MSEDGSNVHATAPTDAGILPASIKDSARVVLVVDEDEAQRRLILRSLRPLYTVYAVGAEGEAEEVLATVPTVACVVASMQSGAGIARKMRGNNRLRNVAVFLVAGRGSPDDVVTGINVGARHVFRGPVQLKELLEKVGGVMANG
jgi:DNA-binding response OmpR family regulator